MPTPTSVIFDFGGVLIRWKPTEIAASFYAENVLRERVQHAIFQHADWQDLDRGTLDEELAVERFAARMGRPADEMERFLQHVRDSLIPIDESFLLVLRLAQQGVPLYGLSNMSVKTFSQLRERHDIWHVFKGIVISGEIRMTKPDARIFEYTLRRYGLKSSETVFIDDHPPNIESARQFGFRTILFSNPTQCADELSAMF